jgi:hypothetical protein
VTAQFAVPAGDRAVVTILFLQMATDDRIGLPFLTNLESFPPLLVALVSRTTTDEIASNRPTFSLATN